MSIRRSILVLQMMMVLSASMLQAQQSYRGTYRIAAPVAEAVARHVSEETVWRFSVMRVDGSVAAEIRRAMPYDVAAPEPLVFENGRVLLLHSFDAYAELFDMNGDLLRRIPLIDAPAPDFERTVRSAVHASQAIVGVTLEGQGVRVVSIDDDGHLSVRRVIEGMNLTGIAVAEEPGLVAAGTMSWKDGAPSYGTTFLDGDEQWSIPKGCVKGAFLADGRFVGTDDRGIFVAILAERAVDWSEEVPKGRMLVDAAVTQNGISLLTADRPVFRDGAWVYTAGQLRTFDRSGKIVTDRALRRTRFTKGLLESAGGRVSVVLDGETVEIN